MSMSTQPPKPKRRWYQFSLRTLLIVITIAIVAFGGWVQFMRYQADENRERVAAVEQAIKKTVARIEGLGGEVKSAYQELRPQTWLEKQFDDPGDSDDLVGVRNVTHVKYNHIPYHVFVFPRLHRESISSYCNFSITDAELEHLKGLTNLQGLNLYGTKVTDAGLEHLKGMTNLQDLNLNGATKVTDAGLEHLKGMTNLQDLGLFATKITDAGLEHLKGMTNLQYLELTGTNVTGAGLEHLKGMTNLQDLGLSLTNVTDAGLEYLNGLSSLRSLDLEGTDVTDEGVKKLQQALPNCKIKH